MISKFNENKIPIGKPIGNKKVYIMDGQCLCGIGIPGELCIAGSGLARGYLNQPELTAEKFVRNPFGEGRLYHTGDLARWLPNGNIEFLGRIDDQVKIRGFRVELGEIESAIRTQVNVRDTAVVAKEVDGEKSICAYIVVDGEVDVLSIEDSLRELLPDYMIPAYIMEIESLPLTSNGKLDKRALPEPGTKSNLEYIAPNTETEKAIIAVFKKILGVELISVNDDFFRMGGDSIKAIRVVSRLREAGYEITVKDLMQQRTAKTIARFIKSLNKESTISYSQEEVIGNVPLTPIQLDFFHSDNAAPWHFNQALMLYAKAGFDDSALRFTLDRIVEHHDALRSVFRNGKQIIRPISDGNLYDFYEYSHLSFDNIQATCDRIQASINLETGPLVKVALFRTNDGDHLLFCIHHLVVDGVSWRILLEDLDNGYRQAVNGEVVKLPAKTASYKEWAENLQQLASERDNQLDDECEYWDKIEAQKAKGSMSVSHSGDSYGTITFGIDQKSTDQLLHRAGNAYGTEINDLLLAALGLAVHTWDGSEQVTVDLEGHGREQVGKPLQTDRTVGWFTSIYPVVLKVQSNTEDTIIETKELLRAVPNHGIGYGILRNLRGRYQSKAPVIGFNYLGDLDQDAHSTSLIGMSNLSVGQTSSAENATGHDISIDGSVTDGKLTFNISYLKSIYSIDSMDNLGKAYIDALETVIQECISQKEAVRTASDYGSDISQDVLSKVLDMFS